MTNFIPVFPLPLVIYPGEMVNLHIFGPQLVADCREQQKPFGIPVIISGKTNEYGTLVEIRSVERMYGNGEVDVRVQGTAVFRILELIGEVPGKLYAGAIVNYPPNTNAGDPLLMHRIVKSIRRLQAIRKIFRDFGKPDEALGSYDVAHHAGLSREEEYEMLCLLQERQRQEYLRLHLSKVIPL